MKSKKLVSKALALVLAAVLTVGLLPIQASAATTDFTDVPEGTWYYADVTELASKGVVSGVGQNKFEPNRTVANAEMIKMVVNAFFRSDYAAYEAANSSTMYAYFGTQLYWFSFMSYYARQTNLLDGIDVDIRNYASCYQPMTRNDMAMILANTAKAKGIAPTEAQKAAVQADIKDYDSIPAKYQDAVKTCFALKTTNANGDVKSLLEGDNGWFYGRDGTSINMTRAEACAVIVRLDNLITNGGGSTVDPDPTPSEPTVPTVKDVQTSSEYWSGNATDAYGKPTTTSGQAWTVTDNGNPDGYLNNGKPITPENVIELLAQAEKVWPTGTRWANYGANNNFYKSSGSVVSRMMKTPNTGLSLNAGTNFGCSGYAAMISDYLFGRDVNDFHVVTDKVNGIRPGDIILMIDTDGSRVVHAMVATSANFVEYEGNGTPHPGFVYITDGNNGEKVSWPGKYDSGVSEANDSYTWQVYSRYPASTVTQPATPTTNPDPTPSTPDEPAVKDIEVTSEYWSGNATDEKGQPTTTSGNAWTITDNGFGDGRLNNGKPITEENVIELLHEAEKIWPANMTWSNRGSGNNFYKSSGTVVSRMMKTVNTGAVHNVGSNFGCGGYAAMISDYLFGRDSNNFHRVIDPTAIRPGDIIIQINTSTNYVSHVIVAVTAPGGSYTGLNSTTNANRAGYIHFTDGNNGNMVNWPGIYSAPTNASIVDGETWQIYSRYPA